MNNIDSYNEYTPRELCKKCYNWNQSTCEPWEDISGCVRNIGYNAAHEFLMGYTDDCLLFEEN